MEENDKRKIDIKENKWENQNYIKTIGRDTEVKEDGEKRKTRDPQAKDPGMLHMNAPVLSQTCTKQPLVITLIDKDSRLIE